MTRRRRTVRGLRGDRVRAVRAVDPLDKALGHRPEEFIFVGVQSDDDIAMLRLDQAAKLRDALDELLGPPPRRKRHG